MTEGIDKAEARGKLEIVGSLCRLRPDASPDFKRTFAKQFSEMLDLVGVDPGDPFYIVTAPMLETALEDAEDSRSEADDAKNELEEKGKGAEKAIEDASAVIEHCDAVLADFERGIYDLTEVREQLRRLAGDVEELRSA